MNYFEFLLKKTYLKLVSKADCGNGAGEAKGLAPSLHEASGVRLSGLPKPLWELQKEQPWHRAAAFMYALGASGVQIARELGKTPQAVSNLTHQALFQEKVTAILAENVGRDVMELFKAERINSLLALVAIRDDEKAPTAARVQAARDILDRAIGRPAQRVEVTGEVKSLDPLAEVEKLEAEVKRLREDSLAEQR